METSFCTGLCRNNPPQCAVQRIYNGIKLDDVILGKRLISLSCLVCHRNAIKINSGRIVIGKECDNCRLCLFVCPELSCKECTNDMEKSVLFSLDKLNIFLSKVCCNSTVVTEVKISGRYRDKRIDAIVFQNSKIFLIKVLQNIDKYNFYCRSYREIVDTFIQEKKGVFVKVIFIVKQADVDRAKRLKYDVIDICTLKKICEEEGL